MSKFLMMVAVFLSVMIIGSCKTKHEALRCTENEAIDFVKSEMSSKFNSLDMSESLLTLDIEFEIDECSGTFISKNVNHWVVDGIVMLIGNSGPIFDTPKPFRWIVKKNGEIGPDWVVISTGK